MSSSPASETKNQKKAAPVREAQRKSTRDDYSDESESDYSSEEEAPPPPRRRRQRPQRDEESGGQLAPVKNATDQAQQAVGGVTDTAGGAGQAVGGLLGKKEDKKDETLRLRLDLNLDVDIQLKARIHGDLTLALLS